MTRRPPRRLWHAAWLAPLLVLAACGNPGGGLDEPPAAADAAAGEAVYAANCAQCHGPAGEGTEQGPPLVHIIYEPAHHADESFRRAVRQGVTPHHWDFGPMPPQPQVDDEELEAVIAYIRGLQQEAGIE